MEKRLQTASLLVTMSIAVGGVLLYLIGTVAIASQLEGAGVDPLDGPGFFSVSQILLRGIAVVVDPYAAVLTGGLIISGLWLYSRHDEGEGHAPLDMKARVMMSLIYSLLCAVIIFRGVGEARLHTLVMLAVPVTVLYLMFRGERLVPHARGLSLALVGSTVIFLFLRAWFVPHPLPVIALKLKPAAVTSSKIRTVYGELVGLDAGVWYLHRRGFTTAIPDSRVVEASISSSFPWSVKPPPGPVG